MSEPIYLTNQEARMEVNRWYHRFKFTWGADQTLVYLSPYTGGARMGLHATLRVPSVSEATVIYPVLAQDKSMEIATAVRMGIVPRTATYKFIGSHSDFLATIKRTWFECIGDIKDGRAKIHAADVFTRAVTEDD